jgi:hypothetical protein
VTPLSELETIVREYGGTFAVQKRALVRRLARARFRRLDELARFHELCCFLRAYPDDAALLESVVRTLDGFERRADLRRWTKQLADSGIVGTAIHFPFYWVTAERLARHFPERLSVDWNEVGERERAGLARLLPLLLPSAEAPDFTQPRSAEEWLARLKGRDETDATFLVRRFARVDARAREPLFNELALPLVLSAGSGGPSRTRAFHATGEVVFRTRLLSRERPTLRRATRMAPRSVRKASRREAAELIDLARDSMITRSRDLDAFMYASPDDVRVIDAGDGLSLACMGLVPAQRALVETLYVFLLLMNGVPIGYYQAALSFDSAELNYNVFPSFRGGETALIYARALGVVRHLFAPDAFSVHPYQLGQGNPDALRSGAFWFYEKLGYQPEDPAVLRLLAREKRSLAKNPHHRSSPATLGKLASGYLFFYLAKRREDVAGKVNLSRIALAVSDHLAARFGSDRERGLATCRRECAGALGIGLRGLARGERIALERWAPLCLTLGAERWPSAERRALAEVILAKGGVREEAFARRLAGHRRLRRGLVALSRRG